MCKPKHLILRRKDGHPLELDSWRRAASACGVEVTDTYEGIDPFTTEPLIFSIDGSGRWQRANDVVHLRFRGKDVHIRQFSDTDDPQLNRLADLLDAELVIEDQA